MVHNFHLQLRWNRGGKVFLISAKSDLAGEADGLLAEDKLREFHDRQSKLFDEHNWSKAVGQQWAAAVSHGKELFAAIMGDSVQSLFHAAAKEAWRRGDLLRLVLELEGCLDETVQWIHGMCWELLFDPARDTFLAIDPDVVLVRYLCQPRPVGGAGISSGSLRVFATSACPPECKPLLIDEEIEMMEQMFAWPRMRESVDAATKRRINFGDLRGRLIVAEQREQPFHVWHHCGHGHFDKISRQFQLAFEYGTPRTPFAGPWIGAPEVVQLLGECSALQLVFLNVCLGADPGGLCTLLAGLGVPAVIGHNVAVKDLVALKFSREFWRAFATQPVDEAVQRARQILAGSFAPLAFAQAVIFLRSLEPLVSKAGTH